MHLVAPVVVGITVNHLTKIPGHVSIKPDIVKPKMEPGGREIACRKKDQYKRKQENSQSGKQLARPPDRLDWANAGLVHMHGSHGWQTNG